MSNYRSEESTWFRWQRRAKLADSRLAAMQLEAQRLQAEAAERSQEALERAIADRDAEESYQEYLIHGPTGFTTGF